MDPSLRPKRFSEDRTQLQVKVLWYPTSQLLKTECGNFAILWQCCNTVTMFNTVAMSHLQRRLLPSGLLSDIGLPPTVANTTVARSSTTLLIDSIILKILSGINNPMPLNKSKKYPFFAGINCKILGKSENRLIQIGRLPRNLNCARKISSSI